MGKPRADPHAALYAAAEDSKAPLHFTITGVPASVSTCTTAEGITSTTSAKQEL